MTYEDIQEANELSASSPPDNAARFVIKLFPPIGFCSKKKRIIAFQYIACLLEVYRRNGGDFAQALFFIIDWHKPAKKAVAMAMINKERFGVGDLDIAGHIILRNMPPIFSTLP